jgi:TPR repeat protein
LLRNAEAKQGQGNQMEYLDIGDVALESAPENADSFYELGMKYSVGESVPTDFVSAHKWFNIAALKGKTDAIRLRQEIASQMSLAEIATAQRAARAWIGTH